jgi:hypothetical protein
MVSSNTLYQSSSVTDRDFRQLEHALEETFSLLKGTKDPKLRRDLLLEMRRLLVEADRLNKQE